MHGRLHGRRASYLQNTASTRAAENESERPGDQGHAQATPRHCTFFLELGNFAGTSKLSVRSGAGTREQANERTYLSRRSCRCDSGSSFLLRPSLRTWKCRWKISRQQPETIQHQWPETITGGASWSGRLLCLAH